jgi:hypothetical protein
MKTVLLLIALVSLNALLLTAPASEQASEVKQWQEVIQIDGEKGKVHVFSKTVSPSFEARVAADEFKTCAIGIVTDYWQEDDQIKVETLVENQECEPSRHFYSFVELC